MGGKHEYCILGLQLFLPFGLGQFCNVFRIKIDEPFIDKIDAILSSCSKL